MTMAEDRVLIMSEWDRWCDTNLPADDGPRSTNDAFAFHGYLTTERPDLLRFRHRGDSWQVVHGWLLSSGKLRRD